MLGLITPAEKSAIENIVGHSRATCLNFYKLYVRLDDIKAAYNAYRSLANLPEDSPEDGSGPRFIAPPPVVPEYGAAHPVKGYALKVPYSDVEKGIIGVIIEWVSISYFLFLILNYILSTKIIPMFARSRQDGRNAKMYMLWL